MPIYEYRCDGCAHELEKLQKMADEPLTLCPQCGEPKLRRKISAAGFRLKGSGWYETDFKGGGSKKNLAGEAAAPAKADQSSSAPAATSTTNATPAAASSTSTSTSSN